MRKDHMFICLFNITGVPETPGTPSLRPLSPVNDVKVGSPALRCLASSAGGERGRVSRPVPKAAVRRIPPGTPGLTEHDVAQKGPWSVRAPTGIGLRT